MRPELAFDVCHAVYCVMRELHGWRIPSVTPGGEDAQRQQGGGRAPILPTPGDYLADFERAGCAALSDRPSRLILFRVHYLGGAPYERARRHCGVSPEGWEQWTAEIRGRVGEELIRRKIYPPAAYFRDPLP